MCRACWSRWARPAMAGLPPLPPPAPKAAGSCAQPPSPSSFLSFMPPLPLQVGQHKLVCWWGAACRRGERRAGVDSRCCAGHSAAASSPSRAARQPCRALSSSPSWQPGGGRRRQGAVSLQRPDCYSPGHLCAAELQRHSSRPAASTAAGQPPGLAGCRRCSICRGCSGACAARRLGRRGSGAHAGWQRACASWRQPGGRACQPVGV